MSKRPVPSSLHAAFFAAPSISMGYHHRVITLRVRAARAVQLLRELWTSDVAGEETDAVLDERRRGNLARLVPVLAVMLPVHVAHVALFLARGPGSTDPARVEWHLRIVLTHVLFSVVALGGLLLAPRVRSALARGRRGLPQPELFAAAYLAFGAVLAAFDQTVTSAVTPYIGAAIAVAVTLRASPRLALALQAFGLALFVIGQVLSQPNDEVRLSNLVNG
ncbi:hypothetical protein L6R52_42570, partial [Myxococcota bacterium]|nr:hypothetical protein [Myxococcota bacterium]